MSEEKSNDKAKGDNKSEDKPKLKPCCACPETKRPRDEWFVLLFND